MKNKLNIAWQMHALANHTARPENAKMFKKCLRAYIIECIIFGKEEFKVKFGSEYYDSFKSRLKDWGEYIENRFIIVPIYRLVPKECRPSIIDYYIKHGVDKPTHIKHHKYVSECLLEYLLDESGLEIVDEYIGSLETIYYIKIKEKRG